MHSSPNDKSIRLIHITDTHLGQQTGERLLGLDPDESLGDVVGLIQTLETAPDHLVITGDVGAGGEPESYRRLLDVLGRDLALPMNWLPGNHDSVTAMLAASPQASKTVVELGEWMLVMLDTSVSGEAYGYLSVRELQDLEATLKQYAGRPTLVFLHHHPVPLGSVWLDGIQLRNARDLFAVLAPFPQIKALSWGHVHQEYYGEHQGIRLLATPSTCIQFKPGQDEFTLDDRMPAYRWYELHGDGSFETGVNRVASKSYGINFDSEGY